LFGIDYKPIIGLPASGDGSTNINISIHKGFLINDFFFIFMEGTELYNEIKKREYRKKRIHNNKMRLYFYPVDSKIISKIDNSILLKCGLSEGRLHHVINPYFLLSLIMWFPCIFLLISNIFLEYPITQTLGSPNLYIVLLPFLYPTLIYLHLNKLKDKMYYVLAHYLFSLFNYAVLYSYFMWNWHYHAYVSAIIAIISIITIVITTERLIAYRDFMEW